MAGHNSSVTGPAQKLTHAVDHSQGSSDVSTSWFCGDENWAVRVSWPSVYAMAVNPCCLLW